MPVASAALTLTFFCLFWLNCLWAAVRSLEIVYSAQSYHHYHCQAGEVDHIFRVQQLQDIRIQAASSEDCHAVE